MVVILPPRFSSDNPPGVFTAPACNELERLAQAIRWLNLIDAHEGVLPQDLDDLRKEWNSHNRVGGALTPAGDPVSAQTVKDYIEGRMVRIA